MIRPLLLLAALGGATPALCEQPPYYGPGKHWLGIGYKFGYTDKLEKDGSWRIEARVRHGEALNVAMYRAAEKARAGGYRYIRFLRATEQFVSYRFGGGLGMPTGFATVWARPASSPDTPAGCQPLLRGPSVMAGCYTADAAEVMRILGGPGGDRPGLALVDRLDSHGRTIVRSAFGVGMVDRGGQIVPYAAERRAETTQRLPTPGALIAAAFGAPPLRHLEVLPPGTPPAVVARPILPALTGTDTIDAQARFEAERAAQQPVRGRDTRQGWTISD